MTQAWKIALIAIVVITIPVLYTLEVNPLNRTLHADRMMAISLVIGLAIGILLGYYFQKAATEIVGRIRTYAVCIMLSVLVLPLLVSLSNRLLSFQAVENIPIEFIEESPRYSSRFGAYEAAQADSYVTFFYKAEQLHRIQTPQSIFPNAQRGDQMNLPIKKGLWGFEIVQQP